MPIAPLPQFAVDPPCRRLRPALLALLAWFAAPQADAAGDLIFINGFNGCPTVYPDADGDFHGVASGAIVSCTPPAGYALTSDDCDDTDVSVHPGAVDVPDTAYRDENCDGIDGNIARALFVAPSGMDSGDCRINAPCLSITFALSVAALDPMRDQIYVQAGAYDETVALIAGKAIFGGYDLNWVRASRSVPGHVVTLLGRVSAHDLVGLSGPIVEGLVIASHDAMDAGVSSSAVVIEGSAGIVLANLTVSAGAGAAGASAPPADTVAAGDPGGAGNPGCENSTMFCSTCTQPAGGLPGTSTCGHAGGTGGLPGLGPQGGEPGDSGFEGTSGGPGATCSTCAGTVGSDGAAGSAGTSGDGGVALGSFNGTVYEPASGANGTAGGPGQGGGGGGGGGGGTNGCDSYGSSGGGGGGGGCGGSPGQGGGGGGGSFGVILLDSSCTIANSSIGTSSGGSGGTGGTGSTGGLGGKPGPAGTYGGSGEQDDGGFGADGGSGGSGGDGGHGGGGGGGPSIAVVCLGTSSLLLTGSNTTPGSGGLGGASNGINGTDGLSTATYGCN